MPASFHSTRTSASGRLEGEPIRCENRMALGVAGKPAHLRNDRVENQWRCYAADESMRDGAPIHIRAIRSDDKQRLAAHFNALSPHALYHRFFGIRRTLSEDDLVRLTELDFSSHVGLIATLVDGGAERIIGVGRYIVLRDDPHAAEVAFAVLDDYQGRGIGTLLLEHLGRIARASGVTHFCADVMADNQQMLDVFTQSGFSLRRSFDAGIVHVTFPTAETDRLIAASRRRKANPSGCGSA
jgi:GNAT superfamily N-acetyltransferase